MNENQRAELAAMRAEQRALKARLGLLETRLGQFEATAAVPEALPGPVIPPPIPPPVPLSVPLAPPVAPPPVLPMAASVPAASSVDQPEARESLEMQIGTTWLAQAGVVLLLTSLALFSYYLYHNVVPHLGPLAKVSLFYLAAGALTGVGAFLERSRQAQENAKLQNYARVVLAGGLAAVYYVTYIAHWNPHLRVISSAILDGGLLLGWAAFMAWLADRRGSELLATFAVLLAYYTSAINEITLFTLVSNGFLTVAAVFLLRRHLWKVFPFASVLATYGSYGFWRYFHAYAGMDGSPLRSAVGTGGFWLEGTFLLLYWALFTWAAFTAAEGVLTARRRAGFVTSNNGAFFLLGTWALLADYPGAFWKWSLAVGIVLLALAEACRRLPQRMDAETETAYLIEGLLLFTLGLVNYFSGWQLALMLAVQSTFLVLGAGQRASGVLLGAGGVTALLSFIWGVQRVDEAPWITGLAEGAFLVFDAWWSQRQVKKPGNPPGFTRMLVAAPGFFSLLGLAAWLWLIEERVTVDAAKAPVLAGAAVLLTASVYLLRVRAIPVFAQAYLFAAYVHWCLTYAFPALPHAGPPWWNPVGLLAATLALGHWWQRQQAQTSPGRVGHPEGIAAWNACFVVGLLYLWLRPLPHAPNAFWMAETAGLSLAVLGYGLWTGWRSLAQAGQALLVASAVLFFTQWGHPWQGFGAEMWLALAPLLAILATLAVGRRYLAPESDQQPFVAAVTTAYEIAAMALFLVWGSRYIPPETRFSFFCAAGTLVGAAGGVFREKRWLVLSTAPTVLGLGIFWIGYSGGERCNSLHLIGILCLGVQQQFGRRWLGDTARELFPAKAQAALMTAATVCAWGWLSVRMARWHGSAFTLPASWSLFAPMVFALGIVLHERVYRWLALLILGVTLGHILLFDLWQLDFLGQAVTFLCLGIVVLALGFIYNRYQAKFREIF